MALPAFEGNIVATEVEGRLELTGHGHFSLEYSVECGQAFRWEWMGSHYEGVVRGRVIRISQEGDRLLLHPPYDDALPDLVVDYFNLRQDSEQIEGLLGARDPHLRAAASLHPGLKILRQEPWECLISYIISARNNIPSIKKAVGAISQRFGSPIDGTCCRAFPGPEALALAPFDELKECKAAFRTRYIQETARAVCDGRSDLDAIARMDLPDARNALMQLPGVGPKVADCILLFAMGRYESFPIDVWIGRAMRHWYFLGEERPLKSAQEFATSEFGDLAGYANQHLFFHARNIKLGRREGA